jgi:hypothetical protein
VELNGQANEAEDEALLDNDTSSVDVECNFDEVLVGALIQDTTSGLNEESAVVDCQKWNPGGQLCLKDSHDIQPNKTGRNLLGTDTSNFLIRDIVPDHSAEDDIVEGIDPERGKENK